jgi:hypothetical protein
VSPAYPTKKLVMPNILLSVWFVANYLAANGPFDIFFIDSCQNFGNLWTAKSCAKKLASQSSLLIILLQVWSVAVANTLSIHQKYVFSPSFIYTNCHR